MSERQRLGRPPKHIPEKHLSSRLKRKDVISISVTGHSNADPYVNLGYAIVERAVDDWRSLLCNDRVLKGYDNANLPYEAYMGNGYQHISINELRRFFKSEYCALIMANFENGADEILEELERELIEARDRYRALYRFY